MEIAAALSILVLAVPYPLKAWRLGYLAVLLVPAISDEPRFNAVVSLALVIAFVNAGLRSTRLVLWSMWALMLVPVWVWLTPRVATAILTTAALTVIAVALDALSATRQAGHALAEQVAQTEHEEERRAVLEERTRIAREMHDVVAHHMSLIAVQAETAPYRLAELDDRRPPSSARARWPSSRRSAAPRAPRSPTCAACSASCAATRSRSEPRSRGSRTCPSSSRQRGAPASRSSSRCRPDDENVPAAVGLCAYRIVQEALSNARRHAPGSRVAVGIQLDRRPDQPRRHQRSASEPRLGPQAARTRSPRRSRDPGHARTRRAARRIVAAEPTLVGGYAVSATIPLVRA